MLSDVAKIYNIISELSDAEIELLLMESIERGDVKEQDLVTSLLLTQMAEQQALKAINVVMDEFPDGNTKGGTLAQLLSIWAQKDALSALDWFDNNAADSMGMMTDVGYSTIIRTMAKQDLAKATDTVFERAQSSQDLASGLDLLLRDLGSAQAFQDLLQRTQSTVDSELTQTRLIGYFARKSPQLAVEWSERHALDAGKDVEAVKDKIFSSWSYSNFSEAATWRLNNGPPEERQARLDKMLAENTVPHSASKSSFDWLDQQYDLQIDQARANMIKATVYEAPDLAITQLAKIESAELRLETAKSMYHGLEFSSPSKAKSFVESSEFKSELESHFARINKYREERERKSAK